MFTLKSSVTALAIASITTAAPLTNTNSKRQAVDGNYGLALDPGNLDFDISTLQTYKFSYANNSAFFGQIKYQQYSEPLVVSGAGVLSENAGGLSFLSEHAAPTGWQYMYIYPTETKPVGFTVAHAGGSPPEGAVTTGFYFSGGGPLLYGDENKFWACQNPEQKALSTYQVWWNGAGQLPLGVDCKGPIGIDQIDPAQRGN